jgi:hypothetical protein
MLWNVLLALASVGLLCYDMATRPRVMECPPGWGANGAQADGRTGCRMVYGCQDHPNVRGGWVSSCDGELDFYRRIYCASGERAVVTLRGIVTCQATERSK